jgi:hypothetical protein
LLNDVVNGGQVARSHALIVIVYCQRKVEMSYSLPSRNVLF